MIDLEARLTDAVLDIADKLIGGMFARAKSSQERSYVASNRDVGRLMCLFERTIDALGVANESHRDGFAVVNEMVGWPKLVSVRGEVKSLADLTEEDPLIRAADRYITLRKFGPELIEALEFKATRADDPALAAIKLLDDLNQSGKRHLPPDAPMPFRKDWKRLVAEGGRRGRRLYETAVFATLRDKLRSGDIWVERSAGYVMRLGTRGSPSWPGRHVLRPDTLTQTARIIQLKSLADGAGHTFDPVSWAPVKLKTTERRMDLDGDTDSLAFSPDGQQLAIGVGRNVKIFRVTQ
jgi:hypothetical protein